MFFIHSLGPCFHGPGSNISIALSRFGGNRLRGVCFCACVLGVVCVEWILVEHSGLTSSAKEKEDNSGSVRPADQNG